LGAPANPRNPLAFIFVCGGELWAWLNSGARRERSAEQNANRRGGKASFSAETDGDGEADREDGEPTAAAVNQVFDQFSQSRGPHPFAYSKACSVTMGGAPHPRRALLPLERDAPCTGWERLSTPIGPRTIRRGALV